MKKKSQTMIKKNVLQNIKNIKQRNYKINSYHLVSSLNMVARSSFRIF